MGVSTDAILVFGLQLSEDEAETLPWRNGNDIDTWIIEQAKIGEPEGRDYQIPEWKAHFQKCREIRDAFGVDEVMHCSSEYPMYILAVRGTKRRASWGCPEVIDPQAMTVEAAKIEMLKTACERFSVSWREPAWWLCSSRG